MDDLFSISASALALCEIWEMNMPVLKPFLNPAPSPGSTSSDTTFYCRRVIEYARDIAVRLFPLCTFSPGEPKLLFVVPCSKALGFFSKRCTSRLSLTAPTPNTRLLPGLDLTLCNRILRRKRLGRARGGNDNHRHASVAESWRLTRSASTPTLSPTTTSDPKR